jgi:hypothetical protein
MYYSEFISIVGIAEYNSPHIASIMNIHNPLNPDRLVGRLYTIKRNDLTIKLAIIPDHPRRKVRKQ